MIISSLELKNFRNYKSLSISFDKKINILYGNNAQGKTNILEACYLCSTTKSHKASKDREMILNGQDDAHVKAIVNKNDGEYKIDIHLKQGRAKGLALNNVPLKKAGDLFGIVQVIFFSPEDLDIIKRGPQERRRFLDMELCQIDKIYLNDLSVYKKVLIQRNKLLKDIDYDRNLKDTLSVWDEKLIYHGKRIIQRRKLFIEELIEISSVNYKKIAGQNEDLIISYEPNVSEEEFADSLKKNRDKDMRFCQTHSGPHRDDIGFEIKKMDVRKYGSQGQQRSCALSLKLSEIEIMKRHSGQNPVLLLDDVMSELDMNRQSQLLGSLYDIQTIITCTGMDDIIQNGLKADKIFIVENATVRESS